MTHWSLPRPAASTLLMVRVADEYGMSAARCLVGTGLVPAQLVDPATEIGGRQELAVLRNILRTLGPAVPFALVAGQRYHLTIHGMWGFAVLSSPNARSAIEVGLRYFDLSYSFNRIGFEVAGREARWLTSGARSGLRYTAPWPEPAGRGRSQGSGCWARSC